MVLRKITVDNGVRYIPKTEQMKDKEIKSKTTKADSLLLEQKKIFTEKIP